MSQYIPIHELANQMGLTSRTLRYWEEKGLFKSQRDFQSNWRVYDERAIKAIGLVAMLRELDIPIKDVKKIIDNKSSKITVNVLEKKIKKLEQENMQGMKVVSLLTKCLAAIVSAEVTDEKSDWVKSLEGILANQTTSRENIKSEWEEIAMSNNPITTGALRILSLPSMRVAFSNVVSESPEDEALSNVIKWAEKENLMGTARIFGFNTTPFSPESKKYGWAACVTIPESVDVPDYLEEKRFLGGLYAAFNSTNEVYDSWQTLMKLLKECEGYQVDDSRPCLEEHIISGESNGNEFYLTLLEPIVKVD